VRLVGTLHFAQAISGERLRTLSDEEAFIQRDVRCSAPCGHRVLVPDRGGDDRAERDEQDRNEQGNTPLP